MAEYKCTQAGADIIAVEDAVDKDGELEIGIQNYSDDYCHVFLSKEDAEKLALHILDILGKTV